MSRAGRTAAAGGHGAGTRWLRAILAWGLLAAGAPALAGPVIADAVDLAAEGRAAAARGAPLVLLYSQAGCHWCERLRNEHLLPLQVAGDPARPVVFRQIHIDRDTPLRDFAGKPTQHAAFARRQRIRQVPTLHFLDAAGRPLAEAIVGFRTADFYGAYLDDALETARQRLAR